MPANIMKKPIMLIEVAVGRATRTAPPMRSTDDMIISFTERTLVNSLFILLCILLIINRLMSVPIIGEHGLFCQKIPCMKWI